MYTDGAFDMSIDDVLGAGARTRHVAAFSPRPAENAKLRNVLPPEDAAVGRLNEARRTRIFELHSTLHCSLVGTCLTMGEIRHLLIKLEVAGAKRASDHEIHGQGVLLAAQRDAGGKLLNKTLDKKHRGHIARFAKARTANEVLALWTQHVQDGDIPGAYWAAITHQAATDDIVRKIFEDVHMLSHLVGAANRADIRRLRELEARNAELSEKVERQQAALREAVVTRDGIIVGLQYSLAAASTAPPSPRPCVAVGERQTDETDGHVIEALNERLATMRGRHDRLRLKVEQITSERDAARRALAATEQRERALLDEIAALEHQLVADEQIDATNYEMALAGTTILYVGGRPHQTTQLGVAANTFGATFLHHDGGLEERGSLITALISRADLVMFPVDCVSHAAVAAIKKACRQMGKSYRPLRSSGRSSLLAALHEVAEASRQGSIAAATEEAVA
jgi:hypothetical protein